MVGDADQDLVGSAAIAWCGRTTPARCYSRRLKFTSRGEDYAPCPTVLTSKLDPRETPMRVWANSALTSSIFCGLFALAAATAYAQGTPQGNWSVAAQMTAERSEIGTAELNGKVYVLGGVALGREDSPINQEFDPATGRWRDLASMPRGTSHVGVATLNGKIYVAGGFTANVHKNPLDQFAEYDVAKDQWRQLAPLSGPRGSVGLAALGGKLHVIGGRGPDARR